MEHLEPEIDFTRFRVSWSNLLKVGDLQLQAEDVIRHLSDHLTDERKARLEQVANQRSLHMVSVLENIYDRGNVSAVMRSSEAFGFLGMYLVDPPGARFKAANRVTRGAEKWLDVRPFHSPTAAVLDLKAKGYSIWSTDLDTQDSIDTLDWSRPLAIVLGNEKDGVSKEMAGLVDGRFRIPMLGFAQSFNISVAAALIFYRGYLELRRQQGAVLASPQQRQLLANYYLRCFDNPEALLKAKTTSR